MLTTHDAMADLLRRTTATRCTAAVTARTQIALALARREASRLYPGSLAVSSPDVWRLPNGSTIFWINVGVPIAPFSGVHADLYYRSTYHPDNARSAQILWWDHAERMVRDQLLAGTNAIEVLFR